MMTSIIWSENSWKSSLLRGSKERRASSSFEDDPERITGHGDAMMDNGVHTSKPSSTEQSGSIVHICLQFPLLVKPFLFSRIEDGVFIVIKILACSCTRRLGSLLLCDLSFDIPFLFEWGNWRRFWLFFLFFRGILPIALLIR